MVARFRAGVRGESGPGPLLPQDPLKAGGGETRCSRECDPSPRRSSGAAPRRKARESDSIRPIRRCILRKRKGVARMAKVRLAAVSEVPEDGMIARQHDGRTVML